MPAAAAPFYTSSSELVDDIRQWLQRNLAPRPGSTVVPRITFVFGAGISIGLSERNKLAEWTGLIQRLIKSLRFNVPGPPSSEDVPELLERWLRRADMESRLGIIDFMASGNPDMAIASTFLIDRLHRQCRDFSSSSLGTCLQAPHWREEVNTAMYELEEATLRLLDENAVKSNPSPWLEVLGKLGDHAHAGSALVVTTNFDHLLARLCGLPVYAPTMKAFDIRFRNHSKVNYPACPDGLHVPRHIVRQPDALGHATIRDLNTNSLPPPRVFKEYWTRPNSVPATWYPEIASVLHIHGSRQVPHSLVFEPSAYHAATDAEENPFHYVNGNPKGFGPIIYVGCGNTLLDPHFVHHWNNPPANGFRVALLPVAEADRIKAEFRAATYMDPPRICSLSGVGELPNTVNMLLDILPRPGKSAPSKP